MFQVSIYKLFNSDLKHLNNQQLHAHWKVKGIKEQRIYNHDSFYKKYPLFNVENYKKTSSIDLQHKDKISIMLIYHINQHANNQEEKQEKYTSISNKSIKIDPCSNSISNINTSSKDINNHSNNIPLISLKEHSENPESNDTIFSSIVRHIFNTENNNSTNDNLQISNNHIDTIFMINQNIHLSKILNFLNSYFQIKHPLVIYILSVENIDIYKELYKNIIVIYVPFIHNQYVNYYLQKIYFSKNLLIFLNKIPLIHQFYQTVDSYLQIRHISYIYLGENTHIIKNYSTFPNLFISESLFSYISTVNQYNFILSIQFSSSDVISRIHSKFINLYQRNEEKKINKYGKNILIDFIITTWKDYLSFFYLLQFCEENHWNLFLKNGQISFFDKFHELNIQNNVSSCLNFDQFQKILNNNESLEQTQICQNIKVTTPIYDDNMQYNSLFNKYLHFSDIEYILQKLYFINFQKKIIGLYIDSSNYQEQYIFNTLSSLPFEDTYLLIFCEDTTFLENNEFLQSFSFLDIKQLENDIFEKKYILLQYFLICDYLIMNHNFTALIFSYLSITTNIFLPKNQNFNFENNSNKNNNNQTKDDNDISFLIQNYNYHKIQLVSIYDHFLNKKICLFHLFQNYYVYYKDQFILWKDPFTYIKKNIPIIYLNLYMWDILKDKYSLTLSYQIDDFLTVYEKYQTKSETQITKNDDFSHSIFIFKKNKQLFLSYFQKIIQLNEEEQEFCYFISMIYNKSVCNTSYLNNNFINSITYQPLLKYSFCFIITSSSYLFEYTLREIIRFHMNDKYHFLIYLDDIQNDTFDIHSDNNYSTNINNIEHYNQKKEAILHNLHFDHLSSFIDICILPTKTNNSLESILIYSQLCVKLSCETLLIKMHINKLSFYVPIHFLFYYCFELKSDNYTITLLKDIFSFHINDSKNKTIMNNNDIKIIDNDNYGNIKDNNKNKSVYNLLIQDRVQLPFSIDYFLHHNYLYKLEHLNHNTILKYLVFLHESKNNYNLKDNVLCYITESILYFTNQINKYYSLKLNYYNDEKHKCSKKILDLMNINIIHISHRKDKLNTIVQEMIKHNIENFHFFKAHIPSNLDIQQCSFIQRDLLLSPMNEKYIIGSVGCKMSHISLLESLQKKYQIKQKQLNNINYDSKYDTIPELQSHHEYALILEDDVCFDLHFQIYLELGLKALIHQFDNQFDLLYLSVNLQKKEDAELVHPFLLRILHGFTTTSYIVKLDNIDKILDTLYNSKEEIDKVYSECDLIKYCICPMITYQNNMKSDISYVANGYGNYHEKFEFCE
jgi:hypothetical protein